MPAPQTGFEPPISLVVTAFNEAAVIVPSVRALFQLEYPEFEIIIVNDGSTDNSLEVLNEEFELERFDAAFRDRIKHKPVRGVYQSKKYPNLRVIDKENGGCKADAANAGVNAARYGLFMPLDADTILERGCLRIMVQPFLLNPETIAVGGSVKILNGCSVEGGFITKINLSKNWLARFQILEYMRAFMSGRVGWSALDSLPLISGAFGLFNKEAVISVGGYSHKSLGEDMDLVLRLHRHYRLNKRPYRIDYTPDAACWTEVPESFNVLKRQRVRWQRGLFDCMWENRKLLFHPRSGGVGWGSMPFSLFLEGLSPIIEVGGQIFFILCFFFGVLNYEGALVMLALSLCTGFLISITALVLEEIVFKTYPRTSQLWMLCLISFVENLGYHQLMSIWRLEGTIKWIFRTKTSWGTMTRVATWNAAPTETKKLPPLPVKDMTEASKINSPERQTT